MSFEPIIVDMEVAENGQVVDMEVAEQIVVNPPASSYIKLAEKEVTASTTSTTMSLVDTLTVDPASDVYTSAKMIIVTVRDKAGKRTGYFYGSDAIFSNPNSANGTTANFVNPARNTYLYGSNGTFSVNNTNNGVYAYDVQSTGNIRIACRYNATSSLTVDGTYKVEVWALVYPNGTPFA